MPRAGARYAVSAFRAAVWRYEKSRGIAVPRYSVEGLAGIRLAAPSQVSRRDIKGGAARPAH